MVAGPRVTGRIGRIVAVTSCKGGVGKSTVSYELSRRLATRGRAVGLFDADVYGPSLPTQVPAEASAAGVAPSGDGWSMVPLEHEAMKLMSFGWLGKLMGATDGDAVDPRGAGTAGELGVQLLHTTEWGDLDYLVVDTPPGTGEIPRALAARAEFSGAVVVTTPSPLAIADVVRGVAMLAKFEVPVLAVVENMATFTCAGCGAAHHPFGTGMLEDVLAAVKRGSGAAAAAVSLPIVPADAPREPLASALDALVDVLEAAAPPPSATSLPQLSWHERPYWPDKIFFADKGKRRFMKSDLNFKITPPVLDR